MKNCISDGFAASNNFSQTKNLLLDFDKDLSIWSIAKKRYQKYGNYIRKLDAVDLNVANLQINGNYSREFGAIVKRKGVTNTNVIDLNSNIAARYLPGCI
jgi:hypothetical protein